MGLRAILVIVAIIGIILILRRLLGSRVGISRPGPPAIETMVRCKRCGVHVPHSEAIRIGDEFYCSQAHLPPQT